MVKRRLLSRARGAWAETRSTKQANILVLFRSVMGSMWRSLIILTVLSVIVGLAESGVLVIVAQVAVAVSSRASDAAVTLGPLDLRVSLAYIVGVAAVLALVRFLAQSASVAYSTRVMCDTTGRLRMETMAAYLDATWSLKADERRGHLQEVMTTFITNIMASILAFASLLTAVFTFLMLVIAAFILDVRVAGLIALVITLLFALLRPLSRMARTYSRRKANASLQYANSVNEVAGATQDIQAFGTERAVLKRVGKRATEFERMQHHAKLLAGMVPAVYQFLAMMVVIGGLGALALIEGASIAALSAIVLLFVRAASYGQQTQTQLQSLNETAPYIEILRDVQARYRDNELSREGDPLGQIDRLRFDRVSFSYIPDRPALDDVSFDVNRGEFIGVVGPSGAGKSTLVQLLLRLRDPTSGAFLVNGRAAPDWSYDDWVHRVAFVPQEPHLLAATVAENIAFFRPGIDQERIERAARRAHVHGDISEMADGYDTWVGDDGRNVSGGQRQRIAIARALAGEPEIIVLDEPTSALDMRSEQLVQQTFTELRGEVTLLIVAHRLSTLAHCDRIMVFGDGKLQAFDTARGLMETNSFYRQAVELSQLPS